MSDRIEAEIIDVLGEEVAAAVDTPLVVIEGQKGDPGVGVSPGGAAGQMLVKKSGADYDTEWRTPVDPKQIGDLADLTTEAKENLVAAINEAASAGDAGSMALRVADGYIQYSTDSGMTWTNLIAMADLKGDPGDDGVSPTVSTAATTGGTKVTITDAKGSHEFVVKDGSDATVTAANIAVALGYTPAAPGDIPVVPTAEISANTAARHSHANKGVLDGITAEKTAEWDGKSSFSGRYEDLTGKPTALKNPNALTIKIGGTTVTYDGSAAKTVTIDDGSEVAY